ncbi:MAG: hypothetical protein KDI47_05540 [Gammaproteobacteria bacterium]|nr:hypothetical protein [Gammaproteobacteria bacterium]MCB1861177.1 hypothetical protein [Gammaproteobacteria bacterium]MCB1903954.1 hypothetical protein [Gammaproteobacteria bacterium]
MADPYRSCAVCRFMRSLAFSAIGGGLAGYGALGLGLERSSAIIAAFFGALAAVVWISRKRNGERD